MPQAGSIDGACAVQSAKRSDPLVRARSKNAATMNAVAVWVITR
jgi:hypothetical protein